MLGVIWKALRRDKGARGTGSFAVSLVNVKIACRKCDYELTGLKPGACPECGERFDPAEFAAVEPHSIPTWRRVLRRCAAGPAIVFVGGLIAIDSAGSGRGDMAALAILIFVTGAIVGVATIPTAVEPVSFLLFRRHGRAWVRDEPETRAVLLVMAALLCFESVTGVLVLFCLALVAD